MFGSEILEVAVGVIFVYILVSILCTSIREGIEAWMKTRASYLEYGIRQLLHDVEGKGLAKAFFEHPLIFSLFLGEYKPPGSSERRSRLPRGARYPSYIPAKNFALALMDLAARGPADVGGNPDAPVVDLGVIRKGVANLKNPAVERALLSAIDSAQGDLNKAQANLQAWFDSAMDRVSGWYKRTTQWIIFVVALVVAVAMNVNTIVIADFLYRNDGVRSAVVAHAEKASTDSTFPERNYAEAKADLEGMNLPIGWTDSTIVPGRAKVTGSAGSGVDWLTAIFGWLLTALAASMGAPFWFDMLNKIMVIRSTVKPHEKSPEEASEDRQFPGTQAAAAPPVVAPPQGRGDGPPAQPPPLPQGGSPPESADNEGDIDGCGRVVDDITSDEDLPASEGGVA